VLSLLSDALLLLLFDYVRSFLLAKLECEQLILNFLFDVLEEIKG
jgi:hypothetical protein